MKKAENALANLLRTDDSAHTFFNQLPLNVKEEVINQQNEIHTIVDLQKCVDKMIRYE